MVFDYTEQDGLHQFRAISLHDTHVIKEQEIREAIAKIEAELGPVGTGNWQYFVERQQELELVNGQFQPLPNVEDNYSFQVICFSAHHAKLFRNLYLTGGRPDFE